jgi:hypothetical protein
MNGPPDFYLSAAGEMTGDMALIRACRVRGRLHDQFHREHMLIHVDPPVIGQPYGLGARDLTRLIVTARFVGFTLFPISEWPCHVYVSRMLDEGITGSSAFTGEQVEIIAWAWLYRTIAEAKADRSR